MVSRNAVGGSLPCRRSSVIDFPAPEYLLIEISKVPFDRDWSVVLDA